MSKSRLNTREKIQDKALEMFNERGIEYVGLRELAAVLGMRVSNITYYFPTKDDLVYALSRELGKANSGLMVEKENLAMRDFLEMLRRVMNNHVRFKCLLLSVVHLLKQNQQMADAYRKTQSMRSSTLRSNLEALVKGGYLKLDEEAEIDFLVSGISLVSRFWIQEAALSSRRMGTEELIRRYLRFITRLLKPYATSKAKNEMNAFMETS